ncbi:MAG: tRNA epoxyqueuosine(34) reductase QueG [Sphingobacteriales bacterium]|nr:tRNA epoxyqueuosine(34) reductase QueG [Sphingobacteriales bacterium]
MNAAALARHRALIREEALRMGFSHVGFSQAGFLEEEAPRLERWLSGNMHGKMAYMERWFDKRLDPRLLVEGAKSVVSLLYNYFPEKHQPDQVPAISKYAYGTDYHIVIKEKLQALMLHIREHIGEVGGRVFVDSAPVLDRAWAKRSGLGWVGKNSNLIHPKSGSFYFIAELILDLELGQDPPMKDYCGSCTRCIDACPTEAIVAPQVVDGSKCISYFTIELREAIPDKARGTYSDWVFGCDICQDVCPWNRFAIPHNEPRFNSIDEKRLSRSAGEWMEITEDVFRMQFGDSALMRAGLNKIRENVAFISGTGERSAE